MADESKISLTKESAFVDYEVGTLGDLERVSFERERTVTVQDILEKAERDHEGFDILVGDEPADLDTVVRPGQRILLSEDVDGN